MEVAFTVLATAALYFVVFDLPGLIRSGQNAKVKIAEANREAERYKFETARIVHGE